MTPIYLAISEFSEIPGTGASRFWGHPDLPQGNDWPAYTGDDGNEYPYVFMCQINLKDIAHYDTRDLLPHNGLLSFFARIGNYLGDFSDTCRIGGSISDKDDVKVMYFPDCSILEENRYHGRDDLPAQPQALKISFGTDRDNPGDDHALFAKPEHRPWETWDHPFEDWEILLQIDSFEGTDFSMVFMDMGVLDFLISPTDLKQHRFDNVRAIILSS